MRISDWSSDVCSSDLKTPMIAPTKMYDSVPTLTPDEAADLLVKAIIGRPTRIATRLGIFAALINAVAPKAYEVVMNTAFELFPDSAAAKGDRKALKGETEPSGEQIAFASLLRAVHWSILWVRLPLLLHGAFSPAKYI